jgi:hypothetical protein
MKTVTSLVAALLLVVSMSAVSNACTPTTDPKCTGSVTDTIMFYSDHIADLAGSSSPDGFLTNSVTTPGVTDAKGYGGNAINILSKTGDYVNWTHKFSFTPPVGENGIFSATLNISLVDFKTDQDFSNGGGYDDDEYEKYRDPSDGIVKYRYGSDTNKIKREKKTKDDGKTEDKQDYSIDLSCLHKDTSTSSTSSASVLLDGNSNWFDIKAIGDDSKTKFSVLFAELYDGSFSVQLKSTLNDFEIESSTLSIGYCPAPVPEPSTFLLLGAGLISAGLIRRRVKK